MDHLLTRLLVLLLVFCIYYSGKLLIVALLDIHDNHVFLGFGKKPLFTFRIKKLSVAMGIFIPIPFLAKFYSFENGTKNRARYAWEHFDKSAYKRLLVTFGGFFAMIISSMIIFVILEYTEIDSFISKDELNKHGIFPSEYGEEIGFKKGDKVILLNGEDYERFNDLFSPDIILNDSSYYTVLRADDTVKVYIPDDLIEQLSSLPKWFLEPNTPRRITKVVDHSPAYRAGLLKGDVILGIDGESVGGLGKFTEVMESHLYDSVTLKIERNGELIYFKVKPSEEGKIGIYSESVVEYTTTRKTFVEAVTAGISNGFNLIKTNVIAFKRMTSGSLAPTNEIKGPIVNRHAGNTARIFLMVIAVQLLLYSFYEILPLPKSSAWRSVPILVGAIFKKRMSVSIFLRMQKWLWGVVIIAYLWVIVSDFIMFF